MTGDQEAPAAGGDARPTFVIGLGAQKAGTTWVHQYLSEAPQFARGFAKEYHVFDALDVAQMRWRHARILEEAEDAVAAHRNGGEPRAGAFLSAAMMTNPAFYFDFFAGLLQREGITLTADFTPDYALLQPGRMRRIRRGFAKRGVRTVGVLLLRDPVDRTLSAVRMRKRFLPDQVPMDVPEAVAALHDNPAYAARSDYVPTLAMVEECFAEDEVYVGLYEELFRPESVRRLCELIGIGFRDPDFEQRHNAGTLSVDLPDDVVRTVARFHAPVYEAVSLRLGRDVAEVWPSARLL